MIYTTPDYPAPMSFFSPQRSASSLRFAVASKAKATLAACLLAAAAATTVTPAHGAQSLVDTELLLLIDASSSIDASEFSLMMEGYENAFRSAALLSTIQSGVTGSIAVAAAFWSGNDQQEMAVEWTYINDAASMNTFADKIASTTRPFSGASAIGSALDFGTSQFGTETGGATDNGFLSSSRVIDISGDGFDNDTPGGFFAVVAARDNAIAAGVSAINAIPVGSGFMNLYFQFAVIGGSIGTSPATTHPASDFSTVGHSIAASTQSELQAAANESLVSPPIPEPATPALAALGAAFLSYPRRRGRRLRQPSRTTAEQK